jgi:hypothetical protein
MVKGATFWRTILSAVSLVALTAGPALAEKPKEAPRRWLDLPVFRERDAARSLSPHQIDRTPEAGAARDARAIRLRIYADRDYRELVLRWKVKARRSTASTPSSSRCSASGSRSRACATGIGRTSACRWIRC